MTRGIPRSKTVREKISQTLSGQAKPPETRAAMAASKLFDRAKQPEQWAQAYEKKLSMIRTAQDIERLKGEVN